MAILIVPIGEMGSGKSTATQLLKEEANSLGLHVETMAFAAPLKHFTKQVFCFSDYTLWGPSEARNKVQNFSAEDWNRIHQRFSARARDWVRDVMRGAPWPVQHDAVRDLAKWFDGLKGQPISARTVLQTLGTDWGRNKVSPRIWIDYLAAKAAQRPQSTIVVVEDGRFLNEAKDSGGFPILIRRYHQMSLFDTKIHESEAQQGSREMLDFCEKNGMVVDNTGSMDHLRQCMKGVLDTVKLVS